MPAGTPVTFTIQPPRGTADTYAYIVDNVMVQPYSTSNTFTHTFTEPGHYRVIAYALFREDAQHTICSGCAIEYTVPEALSNDAVRINRLRVIQGGEEQPYDVMYGAAGGTAPYTYSLTMRESYLPNNDVEMFNAYLAIHETDWQLRYNEKFGWYEFYRDFSADEEIYIDKEMLDSLEYDHELLICAKDAQGVTSGPVSVWLKAVYSAG